MGAVTSHAQYCSSDDSGGHCPAIDSELAYCVTVSVLRGHDTRLVQWVSNEFGMPSWYHILYTNLNRMGRDVEHDKYRRPRFEITGYLSHSRSNHSKSSIMMRAQTEGQTLTNHIMGKHLVEIPVA